MANWKKMMQWMFLSMNLINIFVESQKSMKYSSQQEQAKKEAKDHELEEEEEKNTSFHEFL